MKCNGKNIFLLTLISILSLGLLMGCPGAAKKELAKGPAFDSV
jgi:hypothetical protein